MNIKYIKLQNGEALISEIMDDNEYNIKVRLPLLTALTSNSEGNVIISFLRWLPFTDVDSDVSIKKGTIITIAPISEAMEKHYAKVAESIRGNVVLDDLEDIDEYDFSGQFGAEPTTTDTVTVKVEQTEEELAFDKALAERGISIKSVLKN